MSKYDVFTNPFSQQIFIQKYSMNGQETWADTARRVTESVCGQLLSPTDKERIFKMILERKFIPGGRYLYSAGRPFHQVNNCLSGNERFLTDKGIKSLKEMSGKRTKVKNWKGQWVNAEIKSFGEQELFEIFLSNGDKIQATANHLWIQPDGSRVNTINLKRVMLTGGEPGELFLDVVDIKSTEIIEEVYCAVVPETNTFTLANGVLTSNCFLFRAEDSREGWAELMYKTTASLMTGGGIGVDYSALRQEGAVIKRTGGKSTGPLATLHMVNELGRHIMQGGQRRSAIWGGLVWSHSDIFKFIKLKNHSPELKSLKEKDFNFPLPMELTNISVIYDTEFFIAIENESHPLHLHAKEVWNLNCLQAFSTAEPGFSFNFRKDNESARNACCEVVSEDDSDKCNLGTIWINRIKDKKELAEVTKSATKFLICGGIYSEVPTEKIKEIGNKNNRIGLGLGGIHEWLMQRGEDYEVTPELHKWLSIWEQESDSTAFITARELNVSVPKGVRAIAPTGTIGILAETTTGIEPLFCKAYKRRYYKDGKWLSQYVVDGSVKRLIDQGIPVEKIQDSYDLTFKQRVKFQADVQNYVDMAISSTCNVPTWGSEENNEKTLQQNSGILLKYAKRLRGFTCYPDGCRGGQPLTRATLQEALANEGTVFEETEKECLNGICGL